MKRKKWFFLAFIMFIAGIIGLITCEVEDDEECKECYTITIDSTGVAYDSTAPETFCGGELEIKENAAPEVFGTDTVKYVCR